MRYTVVLEDEADGGYSASVPALPRSRSQGDTLDAALANIRKPIQLYVEALSEAGDPHRGRQGIRRGRGRLTVAKLPTDLSCPRVRAALERTGFVFVQQKGSHMILRRGSV
jgi:predicted RNase H-like HicB family nuclease